MSILGMAFITYIQVVCMILGVTSIITLKYLGATTNLRINKLLYFTQAYFLVLNEGK